MSTQSRAVIRQFGVITGPAEYQDIADRIITDPPPCFTAGPVVQDYRLPWAFSKQSRPYVENNYNWINHLSNTTIWWLDICCLLHRYQLHVSALMAIFR